MGSTTLSNRCLCSIRTCILLRLCVYIYSFSVVQKKTIGQFTGNFTRSNTYTSGKKRTNGWNLRCSPHSKQEQKTDHSTPPLETGFHVEISGGCKRVNPYVWVINNQVRIFHIHCLWTPKPWKMKVLGPQYMGHNPPKWRLWVPLVDATLKHSSNPPIRPPPWRCANVPYTHKEPMPNEETQRGFVSNGFAALTAKQRRCCGSYLT